MIASTRNKSQGASFAAIAIAFFVAFRMFTRSISSGEARITFAYTAVCMIWSYSASRRFSVSFLLSSTYSSSGSGGITTQAAATGPQSGPRPASSMPAKARPVAQMALSVCVISSKRAFQSFFMLYAPLGFRPNLRLSS